MSALRVLLVDDEVELVSTIMERLQLRGIDAAIATSGEGALSELKNCSFDVVVVDVKMPGMDGLELLQKIKSICPQIQVILLTGRASSQESERGYELGAYDYLIKPIQLDKLVQKLQKAAEQESP